MRDLSRALRVPKYWPSFACKLGMAFAEKFQRNYGPLLDILRQSKPNSYEELIAFDLLDFIADVYGDPDGRQLPEDFLSLQRTIPIVIARELQIPPGQLPTIGDILSTWE